MAKKLNFAVIGCGALAQGTHIPTLAKSQKAVLHTCCDISDEALEICRTKFGALHTSKDWEATVKNPEIDAICLATTQKLRLPVIELAMQYKKPVYVEKPMAVSMDEVRAIQKVVHAANVPFCVGHNRRNSPCMIEAHRIFREQMENPKQAAWRWKRTDERPNRPDDGVASMNVRINDDWYSWKGWVYDLTQAPFGPMLFEMTHFTDLCNWFMKSKPVEVVAIETGMLNHAIIVRYEGGEIATLNMCGNGTFGYPKELYEMMGNGAMVVCDHMVEIRTAGIPDVPQFIKYPFINDHYPNVGTCGGLEGWILKKAAGCADVVKTGDPLKQFAADPDKGHAHALENFIDQINGLRGEVCGVDSAALATAVAFAAIKSAHEKRFVKLEEVL